MSPSQRSSQKLKEAEEQKLYISIESQDMISINLGSSVKEKDLKFHKITSRMQETLEKQELMNQLAKQELEK